MLAISLSSIQRSAAQDTTYRYYPEFTKYSLISSPDSLYSIDTSIVNFNRFHPAEKPFGYLHLGYLGAPANTLFFVPPKEIGIDIGFHQFDPYWRNVEQVKFYDTREPYTAFGYQQGSKGEIVVSILHSQNLNPYLNLGISFNRMRTDGWYQRQVSKISNFDANLRYHSPNNFYYGRIAFVLNDLKMEMNGGLQTENIFNDSTLFDKTLAQVNLDSAQSDWKNNEIAVVNAFNLGRWVDREKKDSVMKKKVIPYFRFQQRFEWERRKYLFDDSKVDAFFYHKRPFSYYGADDSLIYDRYTNEFRLTKIEHDSSKRAFKFSADAFVRHSLYKIQNERHNDDVQEGIIGADFSTLFFNQLRLDALGQLNLLGRNSGDFLLDASLNYFISQTRRAGVEAIIVQNHPTIVEQEYHSAYFNWQNNFSSRVTESADVFYLDSKWKMKVSAGWFSQSNYIYWVGMGTPVQLNTALSGFHVSLEKDFRVSRIHLDNELSYQTFNNDSVVAYPSFFLRSSLYYQNDLFNHALQTKVGVEVTYNNDYFAPGYQSALGQFLIQKKSELHYYPLTDAFLMVKVKAVRAFVQFQNVAQGIIGKGNYSAYQYPMPDRSFKVGFQWLFWN